MSQIQHFTVTGLERKIQRQSKNKITGVYEPLSEPRIYTKLFYTVPNDQSTEDSQSVGGRELELSISNELFEQAAPLLAGKKFIDLQIEVESKLSTVSRFGTMTQIQEFYGVALATK